MKTTTLTFDTVRQAHARIANGLRPTPSAVSAPLSSISEACYAPGPLPETRGQVRLATPSGRWRELPEVELRGFSVGGRRLPAQVVALVPGGRGCEVTLGSDLLGGLALELVREGGRA